MLPRHKSRSVRNGLDSAGVKSHGENVIAGCVLPCAILGKRLERANGFIPLRRFAQFSCAFFLSSSSVPDLNSETETRLEALLPASRNRFSPGQERSYFGRSGAVARRVAGPGGARVEF